MNTETLMNVVAMIDARLAQEDLNWVNAENDPEFSYSMPEYNYMLGQRHGLEELKEYLQISIEADIAAMENSTGE